MPIRTVDGFAIPSSWSDKKVSDSAESVMRGRGGWADAVARHLDV